MLALHSGAMAAQRRYDWLENPTSCNYSLLDRSGEWVLSTQNGHHAEGFDDMPDMTTQGWVETNGHYGHGCACMDVETDAHDRKVTRLLSAHAVPMARCRADRFLPKP